MTTRPIQTRGPTQTRRGFIASLTGTFLVALRVPLSTEHGCVRTSVGGPHPDPRPDVDASRVLTPEEIGDNPDVIALYDGIREIPHIADGIRCQCGCADLPGFRSLLTCFEANGMAITCEICQSEGRMVIRLHKAGRTLEQLRRAVDARFG